MLERNEIVLYGAEGACKIEGTIQKDLGGRTAEYYVLKPVYREKTTVFVPMENPALVAKMQKVLSVEEIYDIIRDIPDQDDSWVDNEEERRTLYRGALAGDDRRELVKMIKALHLHREEQQSIGKKLHLSDERFLKDAEDKLHHEFALVLNIEPDQVVPFIQKELGPKVSGE